MSSPVKAESLVNVLGTVYTHQQTHDGGDLYLTQFGLRHADLLDTRNWYERKWFERQRIRLEGTSAVYRLPTRPLNGRSLDLVVKNCRVGEDVPLDTHTLMEFINAEFNSPWEEFALVMEMREGKYGPSEISIKTQEPLAIYVPPERMQMWQSGRSRHKMNRISARHPGIELDILRQYKLIYGWIHGSNVIEILLRLGVPADGLRPHLERYTTKSMAELEKKGFVVADMKPAHIIVSESDVRAILLSGDEHGEDAIARQIDILDRLIEGGLYSIIDYELLLRTQACEDFVSSSRRHHYLDDMRDRLTATAMPPHLRSQEIFGVPYVHGHVESTGGKMWVLGRNARLFDYFLPERWRRTQAWKLSEANEVYYTYTKDRIHVVWKTSRVGEIPPIYLDKVKSDLARLYGFNSPFEEFAIAQDLNNHGVPTVYMRAIYQTGSAKIERSRDARRYRSHRKIAAIDDVSVLDRDCNYITIRGYYNGPDEWVAAQQGQLCRPMDLRQAHNKSVIDDATHTRLLGLTKEKLAGAGYDGALLDGSDMLIAIAPDETVLKDSHGDIDVRLCNLELVHRL